MNMQNNMPVWMRAFNGWTDQIMREWLKRTNYDLDDIGASYCEAETREFASSIDWDVCHYCLGPCGNCAEKQREQPCCDPCPQDKYGITECTYCPIAMLKKLQSLHCMPV